MRRLFIVGCFITVCFSACRPPEQHFPLRKVADSLATRTAYFEKQVLMQNLTDPMEVAIADDGRVFVVERGGAIHTWDPETGRAMRIGYIPVYMIIEDGLLGLALDPDFLDNGWLYVFYGPADGSDSRLSRFTFKDDTIDPASERILLRIPMQREACCHAAGSLAFGPDGNLYLSVGDNTDHIDNAGGPIDERPGHSISDAQLTSSNTNDLRGKILRIKPEPDGSYSIPDGNLFQGDELHRPEIYIMGLRNAFRISVDPETGWLYFGDVGNGDPPNERGGWGWDEFNQARGPGNYGWPYLTGKNQPYRDYNYETGQVSDPFDPEKLINDSPNNTGARVLPAAKPAMIWYTFGESEEFPVLGAGGINPMAGPVYRRSASHGALAMPDYYIGKHIIYDWMRNWVNLASFDEAGDLTTIEPFLPGMKFFRPMDMEVGSDGTLYIIEWGEGFWGSNADAQVVRIIYHGTNYHGTDRHPTEFEEINRGPDMPRLVIEEPANGSFFSFDEPMQYRVSIEEGYDAGSIQIKTFSGFDTNSFQLESLVGTAGEFTISHKFTHVPDLHYTNRFAEVEACYIDEDIVNHCVKHTLYPFYKEAEHVDYQSLKNASRRTYGIQPASAEFAATALTVMRLKDGAILKYNPINLKGIEAIKLRYKKFGDARLTITTAPRTRKALAEIDLASVKSIRLPELPQIQVLDRLRAAGQGHLIERLERSVYQGWEELTIPVPVLDRPTAGITLELSGEGNNVLLEIDALKFIPQMNPKP